MKAAQTVAIIVRPQAPPEVEIGNGSDIETDPLLRVTLDQLALDFYVWSLDRYVRATGVKKGHLIEEALRHHLQALQEVPGDVIIHPRLLVTRESGQKVVREMSRGKPTPALRDLMRDGD